MNRNQPAVLRLGIVLLVSMMSLGAEAAEISAPATVTLLAAKIPGRKAKLAGSDTVLVVADGMKVDVPAKPGRVRVQAFVRFNGKGQAFQMTPFKLIVGDQTVSVTVDALAAGQPLSVTLVNRGAAVPLLIRRGVLPPEAAAEWRRLEGASVSARGPHQELGKSKTGAGDLEELNPEETVIDASALPMPMVLVERIEVTQLSGPLLVSAVTSDKITYRPGETAQVAVAVENVGGQPASGTLSVDFVEGLDDRRRIGEGEVTVSAGATVTRSFQVPVGADLWGRGIDARVLTAEGTASASHAFGVVTSPYMAAFAGRGLPQFGSERWTPEQAEAQAEKIAAANLAEYANFYEAFAWAPCDFSQMTVSDDEPFHSGQTQYSKRRSAMQTLHRVFHKYGISCVSYGKSCAAGLPGLTYALRHPEQMNVFPKAGFAHESLNVDVIDRMLEGRYRRHGKDEDFWQSWISCWTLMGNLDAANFGCDEIARSAKMFGWDAVRYDGHFSVWRNPAMAARFVRHAADRIQAQIPGFGLGYNYCGPIHSSPEGAFTDIELASCARGGGLIMTEYYRNLLGPVKQNIEHLRWAGDATRLHGGYFLAISDDPSNWSSAMILAGGARPMGPAAFNKFATRFSAYVLDPAMRRLQDPAKVIHPGRNTDFRWDAFVYEKPVSPTESLLVLQLVNVTDQFAFGGKNKPPTGVSAPRNNIEFELALPAGYQAAGVRAWDAADDAAPVSAALIGNRLTIPKLAVWDLVAITLKKTAPAQTLAELCEIPLHLEKAAGASVEQGRQDLQISASVGPDAVGAINEAKVKITPAVLDAVLKQGEPADNNPGAAAYTSADFLQHKAGVDAAAWKGASMPLHLRRRGHLDVLLVRGVFSHLDRLEETLTAIPGATVHDAYLSDGARACRASLEKDNKTCLSGWLERENLAGVDLVILDDIPAAALSLPQRRDLLDFVQGGGSLLVLGGWYSLSKGAWEGSFLEDVLPVEVVQAPHLLRLKEPDQHLAATTEFKAALGAAAPEFSGPGAVEWINHVRVRPGAKVLMAAGKNPVFIAGACGKGSVFVWAGSHSGTPAAPYWEARFWPKILAMTIQTCAAEAATITPPEPAIASRLAKVRAALEGQAVDDLLDAGNAPHNAAAGKALLDDLQFLLDAGGEPDAQTVAKYLLEHWGKFEAAQLDEMTDAIVPKISAAPGWAQLGERYMNDPPQMLGGLVADIAAAALKSVKYATILKWNVQDPVRRLRCIAVSADPAALGALQAEMAAIAQQEKHWADLVASDEYTIDTVHDTYETHLRRPFVAYAMLKCGKRDEETVYQFCRGVLDLPYYAWRQRWILEGAKAGMKDAASAGDPSAIAMAKGRIRSAQTAVARLDRALACALPLFRPEVVGTDAIGMHAAERALAETDSRKAMPLALGYLQALPRETLVSMKTLEQSRLTSVQEAFRARKAK